MTTEKFNEIIHEQNKVTNRIKTSHAENKGKTNKKIPYLSLPEKYGFFAFGADNVT